MLAVLRSGHRSVLSTSHLKSIPRRWKSQLSEEEVIKKVKESDRSMVKLAAVDIDGIPRGKYVAKEKFLSSVKSDILYDNTTETGWHTGYNDFPTQIDLSTFRELPYEDGTPFFLMDFLKPDRSQSLPICPRGLLKKVVQEAKDMGFTPMVGPEYEFFSFRYAPRTPIIVRETPQSLTEKKFQNLIPLTPGMFGYSIQRMNQNREYFSELADTLTRMGVTLEGLHTETGPGALEAALQFGPALKAADSSVIFKMVAKDLGRDYGIIPSFMAKPSSSLPGCGGHIHQSLVDVHGKNVFWDKNDPTGMSATMKHFVAGQLQLLPELMVMYAPTVNSYKRLVEGFWAPTTPTWAVENRTVCLRVIPGGEKSQRVEVRVPGADVNPYLAMAASLASGLHGVRQKLPLPPPTDGNAYTSQTKGPRLPRNLFEAAERLKSSPTAKELLGETFVSHFSATREWEWRQSHKEVTDWELRRYLEII